MTLDRTPKLNCCYAMPARGGRWGACQVLGVSDRGADVVVFDWLGEKPPTLKPLAKAGPMVVNHHAHRGSPDRRYARGPVPADFVALGEREPLVTEEMKPESYGSWLGLGLQVRLQKRWNHEVPKAEIERYKAGNAEVCLGETKAVPRYNPTVGASPHADFPWPADEPVPWQAFDAAGKLSKLMYYGRDAGIVKYVASRKLLTDLSWYEHGQSELDFRGASLSDLRLDVPKRLALRVDQELERLTLSGHGKGRVVSAEHPSSGQELELLLYKSKDGVLPPAVKGLEHLEALMLSELKVLDLRALAKAYPGLKSLTLRGKFARLEHPEALAKLTELHTLWLLDVYDMDVAAFPKPEAMPSLRNASFWGLRKSDVALLRKHFGGTAKQPSPVALEIRGAKNDAWVAANADNPLRDWVDDGEDFGERACKIFAKAYRAASKAKSPEDSKKALVGFVKDLNKLDGKYQSIDTLRREQAYEAYGELVARTPIAQKEADTWFDELRDF